MINEVPEPIRCLRCQPSDATNETANERTTCVAPTAVSMPLGTVSLACGPGGTGLSRCEITVAPGNAGSLPGYGRYLMLCGGAAASTSRTTCSTCPCPPLPPGPRDQRERRKRQSRCLRRRKRTESDRHGRLPPSGRKMWSLHGHRTRTRWRQRRRETRHPHRWLPVKPPRRTQRTKNGVDAGAVTKASRTTVTVVARATASLRTRRGVSSSVKQA